MISTMLEFSNFDNVFTNDIVGVFSVYKIINTPYQRIKIKEKNLSLNNLNEIFDDIIETKLDYEYSIFSLNTELTYDNKNIGGRISINISNSYNTFTNLSINKVQELYPLKINISLMHRFYLVLSSLVLLKNYYKQNINVTEFYMDFINSIEGIILQKNFKNIKIVICIDKDFTITELHFISTFIKKILYLDQSVTFKFNYYNDIKKNHIIK